MHGRPLVNPFPKARGAERASQRPPQPDAAVPAAVSASGVSAEGAQAGPAEHPGPGVQRPLRGLGLQQGSGLGRVLHVHRRPRLRTARRLPGPRGARGAGDQCGPQGQPGAATAAGLDRRVRVVAALPAGDAGPGPERAEGGIVVDVAPSVPAADLRRHPDGLQQGQHRAGRELDTARSAAFRREEDGPRPGPDPGRRRSGSSGTPTSPPPRSTPRRLPTRSLPMSWPTTSGSGRSGPSLPHRRRPATDPRCWRRCSAPRPPTEEPDDRRSAPASRSPRPAPPRRDSRPDGSRGHPSGAGGRPVKAGKR